MPISIPKIGKFGTSIKTPKISMPKIKLVYSPKIGYAKSSMSQSSKVKIKYK